MNFLLDTCVIIDIIRGDKNSIEKLKPLSTLQGHISTITEFELRYGVEKSTGNRPKKMNLIKSILSEISIVSFRSKEAFEAAVIRDELGRKGTSVGPYDILIAATTKANDLMLVTSNVNEFNRIPVLNIENWRVDDDH